MPELIEEFARLAGITPAVRPGVVCTPKRLSFATDPGASLEALHEFVAIALAGGPAITLDLSGCRELDIAATSVLMALARDVREREVQVNIVRPEGEYASDVLAVSGLANLVDKPASVVLPPDAVLSLDRMPRDPEWSPAELERQVGHQVNRVWKRLKQKVAERGEALDEVFREDCSFILSEAAMNAVEHSGSGVWVCATLLDRPDLRPLLQVTIFNFGLSMADSLRTMGSESMSQEVIAEIYTEHQRGDAFSAEWNELNLYGLCAIQERMSRFGHEGARGFGTHYMINRFATVRERAGGDSVCRMYWISGSTGIYLDGRFALGPSRLRTRKGREDIAFNEANDLREVPDFQSVRNLALPFPGTLVSLQVPLVTQSIP